MQTSATMKTKSKILTVICLVLFTILLSDCSKCVSPASGTLSSGKWELIKIVSPSKIQTSFSSKEILQFSSGATTTQNTHTLETIQSSNGAAETKEWQTFLNDCPENSVYVTYADGLVRKFWITYDRSDPFVMEATGYVKEIGSPADTVRYVYSRTQ